MLKMNQKQLWVWVGLAISGQASAMEESFQGYLTPKTEVLLKEVASLDQAKMDRAGTPAAAAAGAVGGAVAAMVDHVWDKYVKGGDRQELRQISPQEFDLYLSPSQTKMELDSLRNEMGKETFSQYLSPKTLKLVELYASLPENYNQVESPLRDNLAAAAAGAAAGALAYKAVEWAMDKATGSDARDSVKPVLETDFDL